MRKKGKEETYLKDDAALTEFLLSAGLKDVKITSAKNSAATQDIKKLVVSIQRLYSLLKASSAKYDADILYYFLSKVPNIEGTLNDKNKLQTALDDLAIWIKENPNFGITAIQSKIVEENGRFFAEIFSERFAEKTTSKISSDILKASEWIELNNLWSHIQSVSLLPIRMTLDTAEHSFENYKDFYSYVMENTKKGYYIQRYKGLGEMNPEQLWTTTLNPENRNLLQVSVDDAVAADETFSVLMGEQVEPRRKFIHDNALMVRSLDV